MNQNVHYLTPPLPTGAMQFAPCGLLRDVALFIYSQAPYPVPEVAQAASIGLIAGIAGSAFQTPTHAGLNLYTMAVAPTGIGKEAGAEGVDGLMSAVLPTLPAAKQFIGPSRFSSEAAIHRHLEKSRSFVSMIGESGKWLQRVSNPRGSQHDRDVATVLLKLYSKSSAHSIYRGAAYAKEDDNIADILSPAVSIYAEGTPETVFSALSDDFITDGLFPRFLIFEHAGAWPARNVNRQRQPSTHVTEHLRALCQRALDLLQQQQYVEVRIEADADAILTAFHDEIRRVLETADDEVTRHLWTRSYLRAMKLACLCAVGTNCQMPTVTTEMVVWAINIEQAATNNVISKIVHGETGDIAKSETAQMNKMREVMNEWLAKPWPELAGYNVGNETMHSMRLIPWSFISKRLRNKPVFEKGHNGANATLKRTIDALISNGEYAELRDFQKREEIKFSGRLFVPANEHDFWKHNGNYLKAR
ncbi:MAG: DUF3987 domain-containing protein [Roseitalea porphyridii]|jgi:hypothetical protein|uniref:DUF3987 domain-containing protein n=1 Tax=Roseitalea porphyridii TaxID=1852022 RepID=UPI0032EF83BB